MVVLLASFQRSTLPAVGELADIYADPSRTVRDVGSSAVSDDCLPVPRDAVPF